MPKTEEGYSSASQCPIDLTQFKDEFPGGILKLYVHYLDPKNPKFSYTLVHSSSISKPVTVGQLRSTFVEEYNEKFSIGLSRQNSVISDGKYAVDEARFLPIVFENFADVFVVIKEDKPKPTPSAKPRKTKSAKPQSSTKPMSQQEQANLVGMFKEALALQQRGLLKKARQKFQAVAKRARKFSDAVGLQLSSLCEESVANIFLHNKKNKEAKDCLQRSKTSTLGLKGLFLLGQACFELKEYDAAAKYFSKAKSLVTGSSQEDVGNSQDLRVWIARSLYAQDAKSVEALKIYEEVLTENPQHGMATIQYAKIAVERGKASQAIAHILQTLIICSRTPKVNPELLDCAKSLFAEVIAMPGMVDNLMQNIAGAAQSPPALGYLATVAKDNSVLDPCIDLLERALKLSSMQEGSLLNLTLGYMHVLELTFECQGAFVRFKEVLAKEPDLKVGSVSNRDVLKILGGITNVTNRDLLKGTSSECPKWEAIDTLCDEGKCQVIIPSIEKGVKEEKKSCTTYNDLELDLLGMWFAVIKILYIAGCVQPLPKLFKLIDSLRDGQELHLTSIRNEHAYYCTVSQVLEHWSGPQVDWKEEKDDIIYFVADSHSVAPGWQKISWHGKAKFLVPLLVTGLKCWHLRPSNKFFTKKNFENALERIPDGSNVIFGFGEIDCREGLLMAVARDRYRDLEEAIRACVKVYIDALEEAVLTKDLVAFVHPIVPVLDATRDTVKQFNKCLKTSVGDSKSLTFLDFFDKLLINNGKEFNPEYELDGTHMNPKYLPLLENALNVATAKNHDNQT